MNNRRTLSAGRRPRRRPGARRPAGRSSRRIWRCSDPMTGLSWLGRSALPRHLVIPDHERRTNVSRLRARVAGKTQSVLVVRLDGVGDVLLAGPAVRAVAEGPSQAVLLAGPRGRAGGTAPAGETAV